MKGSHWLALLWLLLTTSVWAHAVKLNPHHPDSYVVKTGDTLWDISARFLQEPWQWPELWQTNQHIQNPHLIYPGDIIVLKHQNGRYFLTVEGGGSVKLSPRVRSHDAHQAIPAIPLTVIKPFLHESMVLNVDELDKAPYVVAHAGERVVTGLGDKIYVRGLVADTVRNFGLYRAGDAYIDPETKSVLGYAALHVGEARLTKAGDPATLVLTKSKQEILIGDRLFPYDNEQLQLSFMPRAPSNPINGQILSVLGGVTQIGRYNVVVINRGLDDHLLVGDVLAIYQMGPTVRDTVSEKKDEFIKLPDTRAGELMIFRTFPKVSYGIVMRATKPLHVLDKVTDPDQQVT